MQATRKALFITHEGFSSSIFRSQVIEHCESMLEHGILFEILTYETFKKSRAASVSNFGDYVKWGRVPITLKNAINIYLPGSTLINCFILAKDLLRLSRSGNYEFIHARAD